MARLIARIRWAIEAGVDWIQIREKDLGGGSLRNWRAGLWRRGGKGRRTRVIVNDRLDVAVAAGAGGVHLGRESLPVREVAAWRAKEKTARADLADFLIGASCHSLEEARAAAWDGADYLIFGPVFETPSKMKFGAPLGIEKLREVCGEIRIPVLAIGGISWRTRRSVLRQARRGLRRFGLFQDAANMDELRRRIEALRQL